MPRGIYPHPILEPNIVCDYCQKTFHTTPSRKKDGRRFCSNECRILTKGTAEERFWRNIDQNTCLGEACGCHKGIGHCWPWTGFCNARGYGVFFSYPSKILIHRFAYGLKHGIPESEVFILHKCDNPPCGREEHLFSGTHQDNMDDMVRKGRHAPTEVCKIIMQQAAPRGERHWATTLTNEEVFTIRLLHGKALQREVAEQFHTSRKTISNIWRGFTWKHLP